MRGCRMPGASLGRGRRASAWPSQSGCPGAGGWQLNDRQSQNLLDHPRSIMHAAPAGLTYGTHVAVNGGVRGSCGGLRPAMPLYLLLLCAGAGSAGSVTMDATTLCVFRPALAARRGD
jgi:hypothetical protein